MSDRKEAIAVFAGLQPPPLTLLSVEKILRSWVTMLKNSVADMVQMESLHRVTIVSLFKEAKMLPVVMYLAEFAEEEKV